MGCRKESKANGVCGSTFSAAVAFVPQCTCQWHTVCAPVNLACDCNEQNTELRRRNLACKCLGKSNVEVHHGRFSTVAVAMACGKVLAIAAHSIAQDEQC